VIKVKEALKCGQPLEKAWVETSLFALYLGTEPLPADLSGFDPGKNGGSRYLAARLLGTDYV